jgi:hypothetical protein
MKVVINKCFGKFSVSKAIYEELGIRWDGYGFMDNKDLDISNDNKDAYRANLYLIRAIEKIGEKEASGRCACLKIIEIPDNIDWFISSYNGMETIHEQHRSW